MKRKLRKIKRKLKRSSSILILITIIIIILIVIVSIFSKNLIDNRNDLKNIETEVEQIHKNLSLETYNYEYINTLDKNITKTNDNIILEEAIEEFAKDYSNELNNLIKEIKDEKYTNLLSADNYQKDGPAFTNSLNYTTEKKNIIKNNHDKLNTIIDKVYYPKYIKERTKDQKLINKFNYLVKEIINKEDLDLLNKDIENSYIILQTSNDIFVYLSRNATSWHIDNNEIVFTDQTVKTEYEKAISRIKEVVK